LQVVQGLPAVPQYCKDTVSQVLPEQHPVAQLVGEHEPAQTPLTQFCGGHFTQAMPAVPQATLSARPGMQVAPEQHPAQVVESQTQLPLTQCRFAPQAALVPQRQTPVAEQPSAVSGSHAVQRPPLGPQVR